MNPQPEAFVIHNGKTILECNAAFCDLFRCDCAAVIGKKIAEIIYSDELRLLALHRGKHIMAQPDEKEFIQPYDFLRCDDTRFWGHSISTRIGDGKYKTVIRWEYDIDN